MKTIIAIIFTLLFPTAAPAADVTVDCDTYYISVFDINDHVTVKADNKVVFDGVISPYFTWADAWPSEKNVHRLVVDVGSTRTVKMVRGCK